MYIVLRGRKHNRRGTTVPGLVSVKAVVKEELYGGICS